MTPKSLLRLPLAILIAGRSLDRPFRPVLDDSTRKAARDHVTRLVILLGKCSTT